MGPTPRYVEAPALAPARFGLLSVAELIEDSDPHLGFGVEYDTLSCGTVAATEVAACIDGETSGDTEDLVDDEGYDRISGGAFNVYSFHKCQLVGRDVSEFDAAARTKLSLGESRAVEAAFAERITGATDVTPTLGTAVHPAVGVGVLADYAGENFAGQPTLHMGPGAATLLKDTLDRYGDHLETLTGLKASVGPGYLKAKTVGARTASASQQWIFVTGPVVVRRGPVATTPMTMKHGAGNQPTNLGGVLAQRPVVVTSECLLAAVLVEAPGVVTR